MVQAVCMGGPVAYLDVSRVAVCFIRFAGQGAQSMAPMESRPPPQHVGEGRAYQRGRRALVRCLPQQPRSALMLMSMDTAFKISCMRSNCGLILVQSRQ